MIVGRLAGTPILKSYQKRDGSEGSRVFMRVAVTRIGDLSRPRNERRTNFIPVVCWGELAKRCAQYLAKGTEVTVSGEFIAESRVIEGSNPVQYREFNCLQANSVQFGRRSSKNATPEQLRSEADALQARIDASADGAQAPAEAAVAGGGNPFAQ
jgi:single-stranded DNA-binding protein